jgi:hypothetical protein
MSVSLRRFRFLAVAVLAALGAVTSSAQAQRTPVTVPPLAAYSVNPNMWIAPGMNLPQFSYNAAVLGRALNQIPPWAYGANPFFGGAAGPYATLSTMNPFYGGYGALAGGYGGYGGLGGLGGWGGYGFLEPYASTFNPYTGYLSGVASVTNANADYLVKVQQAKILRQEAIRSGVDTRRKIIEELLWEQGLRPDAEKERQKLLTAALDRARHAPPATEITSARSLNVLLNHLVAQQGKGERGPNIPIPEDILKSINLTPGDSRANLGLLKNNGELQWPLALQGQAFKEARELMNRRIADAVNVLKFNKKIDRGTLEDMRAALDALTGELAVSINTMSPSEYIEARRYLNLLGDAIKGLQSDNVGNFFNQNWVPQAKSAGELIKFMAANGLQFAPATPGDDPAYRALYHALAAYDAGMTQQLASK